MPRKLYRADLAELIGVKVDSLNRYKLPERDGTDIERGKARPFWYLATARAWIASRPGRGFRTDRLASPDHATTDAHSGT